MSDTPRRPSFGGSNQRTKSPAPSSSHRPHHSHNSSSSSSHQPRAAYNPNLARFKRSNPGSGPHGFGGTYKKGEKGGLRTQLEQVPLAERGLKQTNAVPQADKSRSSSTPSKGGATSASAIKSKLRDLTRLLKKPNLDPTIKKHKEHELKLVQKALEEKQAENAANKIDAKYKIVKFYERRKITRKLAGLQRALSTLYSKTGGDTMSNEEKQIRKEIAKWQLDADYIDYYPHGEKYVSLFRGVGGKKDGDDDSDVDVSDSDDEDAKKKKSAAKPMSEEEIAAAAAALEATRAAIRKRVASAKANAVRKEREAAGTVAPVKRKREETEKDALFEEADSSDEEEEEKKPKKSNKPSAPKDDADEEEDALMMSASSDSEEEDEKPVSKKNKSNKSTNDGSEEQPKSKKQKQK